MASAEALVTLTTSLFNVLVSANAQFFFLGEALVTTTARASELTSAESFPPGAFLTTINGVAAMAIPRTTAATTTSTTTTSTTLSADQTTSTSASAGDGSLGISSTTSSGATVTFTLVVTPSPSVSSSPSNNTNTGLAVGTEIGIAVAVSMVVLLFAAVVFIFCRRRRRVQPKTVDIPGVAPILQRDVKGFMEMDATHGRSELAAGKLAAELDAPRRAKRVTKTLVELP